MKKTAIFLAFTGLALVFLQARSPEESSTSMAGEEVKAVLKTSCYDCHSNGASSDKSKDALNFDEWDSYKTTKKISKLSDIAEVVEEGEMPPGKYLKKNPAAALDKDQKKLLIDWAEEEGEKLLGGQ